MSDYRRHRFHVLDAMRGIAALLVMVFHFYHRSGLPFLANTYVAVDFFFVLSGFVIYHSYHGKIAGQMSFGEYFARRVGRLLPTMAIGLALGLPVLVWMSLHNETSLSLSQIAASTAANFLMLPYLNEAVKTVQGIVVTGQTFPADDPLWSIFAELFASLLFFWLVKWRTRLLARLALIGLVLYAMAALLNRDTGSYLLLDTDIGWNTVTFGSVFPRVLYGFIVGMLIYRRWQSRLQPANWLTQSRADLRAVAVCMLLAATLLCPIRAKGLYSLFAISLIGPGIVMLGATVEVTSKASMAAAQMLGWLSYPIYCFHRPVIMTINEIERYTGRPLMPSVSPQLLAVIVTISISLLFGWLLERHSVQRRLTRLLEFGARAGVVLHVP